MPATRSRATAARATRPVLSEELAGVASVRAATDDVGEGGAEDDADATETAPPGGADGPADGDCPADGD
jgi:hypothetical protein